MKYVLPLYCYQQLYIKTWFFTFPAQNPAIFSIGSGFLNQTPFHIWDWQLWYVSCTGTSEDSYGVKRIPIFDKQSYTEIAVQSNDTSYFINEGNDSFHPVNLVIPIIDLCIVLFNYLETLLLQFCLTSYTGFLRFYDQGKKLRNPLNWRIDLVFFNCGRPSALLYSFIW